MKMPSHRVNSTVVGLALAVLVTLLVAAAAKLGLLEGVELEAYDYLVSRQSLPPPNELLFIDFDDAAMERWGVSQIPRDKLAALIEKASSGGAQIIGLDVLLDEGRGPEEDAQLARAIGDAGNVVLATVFDDGQQQGVEPLPLFRKPALSTGFTNLPQDSDGFLRRSFLWMGTTQRKSESLALAVAVSYLGRPLQRGAGGSYHLGG